MHLRWELGKWKGKNRSDGSGDNSPRISRFSYDSVRLADTVVCDYCMLFLVLKDDHAIVVGTSVASLRLVTGLVLTHSNGIAWIPSLPSNTCICRDLSGSCLGLLVKTDRWSHLQGESNPGVAAHRESVKQTRLQLQAR